MEPEPADSSPRSQYLCGSGPLNSVEDVPLGISKGAVLCDDGSERHLTIINNSDSVKSIDRSLGPAWASVRFAVERRDEDALSPISCGKVLLKPWQQMRISIRPKIFRPRSAICDWELSPEQGFEIHSHQDNFVHNTGMVIFGSLVLVHYCSTISALKEDAQAAGFASAVSLAVLTAWVTLACSPLVRRAALMVSAWLESQFGKRIVPIDLVDFLCNGMSGDPTVRRLKLFAYSVLTGFAVGGFGFGLIVLLRLLVMNGAEAGQNFGRLFPFAYLLFWLTAVFFWLRAYGFELIPEVGRLVGRVSQAGFASAGWKGGK
jgi:hypothetical protein